MILSNKKKLLVGLLLLVLVISVPLTLSILTQKQDQRSKASASTTVYFQPTSSSINPITKNIGDPISLDIMVDPGTNLVTFVKYQIIYDPTKVQLSTTDPIVLNSTVFTSVEGPVISSGSITQSVSIGSDPTKALQKATKIGTISFKAIGSTNGSTTNIAYSTLSQALSAGSGDQASQNILSSTTPATIKINGATAATPTAIPSSAPTPQPTLSEDTTALSFTLLLHGVGAAGDNPNPTANSLSNKNPLHPQRDLKVQIYNVENQIVASVSAPVTYEELTGTFVGTMDLGKNFPSGNYNVKITSDRYLRRLVPGIQQIKSMQENKILNTQMVTGDSNGDNFLNIIDYNALLDCGYGQINPLPMVDANAPFNTSTCQVHKPAVNIDFDDNGVINSYDYNLFLRELSVQNGD